MQKYNTKQKTEISVIISKCKPYDSATNLMYVLLRARSSTKSFILLIFWREFWNICGELVQETALKKAYYIHQAMLPWQTFNQLPWKHVNINIKRIKTRHTSSHISLQDMRNLTNHINLSNIINQMPTLILGQIFT